MKLPSLSSKLDAEDTFEDRYLDVLQNIEFSIVHVYSNDPDLTDWQALQAIEALINEYQAESKGRTAVPSLTDPLVEQTYRVLKHICEWRLGRDDVFQKSDGDGEVIGSVTPPAITREELLACLKRVRKSIKRWSKRGGRQGYLVFVSQFSSYAKD